MAQWVYIESGEIAEYHDEVPRNWRNYSGLRLSKDDIPFMLSIGWYPVTKIPENYNPHTHRLIKYTYDIRENDVLETPVYEEVPQLMEESFEDKKRGFMTLLRSLRNNKLRECDWTQCADVQALFDDATRLAWTSYRQSLRDLPSLYESNDTTSIDLVSWPEVSLNAA